MFPVPNPVRLLVFGIGLALARLGLLDRKRIVRIADFSWPRVVTGLARVSKSAVDVAMVGVASGTVAITGVGFAGPCWGLAFAFDGGIAGGTIAPVSQRFGADAVGELGLAVRSSALLAVVVTLSVTTVFWLFPTELISVLSSDQGATELGAAYLRIVSLGIPSAGLDLIGSRVLVGGDDAYIAITLRASGTVINIILNAVLIFGLDLSVEGATLGTILSNVIATGAFAVGLSRGSLPGVGAFLVVVDPFGPFLDTETIRDLVKIGVPVMGRSFVWTVTEFPILAILDNFGPDVVAAFVIARRIWGLMNTPGWGFGLASSSLVGQALGEDDEQTAEAYGNEVIRFAVATYLISAALVVIFAHPIVLGFIDNPADPTVPIAIDLVYVACIVVILQGVSGGSAGPLDTSGDTRWTFGGQLVEMFLGSIPLTYIGFITSLGLTGLYLASFVEAAIPAVLNYYRFKTGVWKVVSRGHRPKTAADD